jgi:type I restriction enzyme S subunit
MKYKTIPLCELVSIKYGKNQKNVQSENGTVPIYGTGGLMGYATQALYDKPSVLIGRKGTINKVRYVDHPFWTVDTLFYTEVNEDIVIPKYLYYLMSLLDLDAYNEGTTIPSLRTETLNRLEFNIPDVDDQKRVLSVLEPIDIKIQNNKEINDNLTA